MLFIQDGEFAHSNQSLLFENLQLVLQAKEKMAIIGKNGVGKTTLLQIIAGHLLLSSGILQLKTAAYYVPQIAGQYNHMTVAAALRIESKWKALSAILNGETTEKLYEQLDNDWQLEERCREALTYWGLQELEFNQAVATLSGGQKARLFLAGLQVHQPALVLLDEPSNHLDAAGRSLLYKYIQNTKVAMLVVSHDRQLLNLMNATSELTARGLIHYGGNYDFYESQKDVELQARTAELNEKSKAVRKAKETERLTKERQHKLNVRGKAQKEKSGLAKIMMNTLRNNAEKTSAKLKEVHSGKIIQLKDELKQIQLALPDPNQMRFDWKGSGLHAGKRLFEAIAINHQYQHKKLWQRSIDLLINSGERWAIKGNNGTGKTTLLQFITGVLEPAEGLVFRSDFNAVFIDQEYSIVNRKKSVQELARSFNQTGLDEHEINVWLHRFLFKKESWETCCKDLSGGERMRLLLCCFVIGQQSPDMIILDEPTNNLDLENLKILTKALEQYTGTLVVVSHDTRFLEEISIDHEITL